MDETTNTQPAIYIPVTKLEISDDIIVELTIQAKGYAFIEKNLKKVQKMAMNALKNYGSDRVECITITQDMLNVDDFGFRIKPTK